MDEFPYISIVIPTFNEKLYIGNLLSQIKLQKYPRDRVETIIVDNNSEDKTVDIVKSFIKDNPQIKVKFLLEPRQGVNFARNQGGYAAKGEILIFLDADNEIKSDFLQNVATLKNSQISAGSFFTLPNSKLWSDNFIFYLLHLFKILGLKPHDKCFLTKELFFKIKGWNEKVKIGTTVEFNERLKKECLKNGLKYKITDIKIKASMRRFKKQGYLKILWIWFCAYFGLRNRWYDQ